MMRKLGIAAALSLSVAMGACGSDSDTPTPLPDAHLFDAKPITPDSPGATPDAGAPDAGTPAVDAGPTFSGTIALHTVVALDNTADHNASAPFGQANVSFSQNVAPIAGASVTKPFNAPCGAAAYNTADLSPGFDGGNVTFTITHMDNTAGPVVPTCVFNTDTMLYQCGADPLGPVLVDGDKVVVDYPGDAAHKFAAYHDKPAVTAGSHFALTDASLDALFPPDLSGDNDLTVTLDVAATGNSGLALVVVMDASDSTTADPTDLATNSTKTASLTCAEALISNSKVLVPKELLKIVGDINPTKLRVSVFHDGSDLSLAGTSENIVVGQGFVAFPLVPTAKRNR